MHHIYVLLYGVVSYIDLPAVRVLLVEVVEHHAPFIAEVAVGHLQLIRSTAAIHLQAAISISLEFVRT